MKIKYNMIVTIVSLMLLGMTLNSCGSKKKVISSPKSNTTETKGHQGVKSNITIPQEWQTLDIDLDRKDNKKLYQELKGWLGTPYLHGGNTKDGVDCSGLVVQIYKKIYHINLQRNTAKIFEINCKSISAEDLKEGDLVFFSTTKGSAALTHVGIYLKDYKFVHASSSKGVMVNDLRQSYYKKHYAVSGRVQ